jgi:hypothetical protein
MWGFTIARIVWQGWQHHEAAPLRVRIRDKGGSGAADPVGSRRQAVKRANASGTGTPQPRRIRSVCRGHAFRSDPSPLLGLR